MDGESTRGPQSRVSDQQRDRVKEVFLKSPTAYEQFSGTKFIAQLKPGTIKYNTAGDIEVTLLVPSRYGDRFSELGLAQRFPLNVEITRWKPDGTVD